MPAVFVSSAILNALLKLGNFVYLVKVFAWLDGVCKVELSSAHNLVSSGTNSDYRVYTKHTLRFLQFLLLCFSAFLFI